MIKHGALLCLLVLAACSSGETKLTLLDQPRDAPTVPPPAWQQVQNALTLDNVPNIQLLGRLDNPLNPSTVFDHAISPDATRLAGLDDQQLVVWDLVSGQVVFSTGRQEEATRVFFSLDKTEVYEVELNGLTTVHDAETGQTATTFHGIDNHNGVLAYDPDEGWLAFADQRGQVRVWDTLERQAIVTLEAHRTAVTRLIFSADGSLLATADDSGEVKVWDWRSRSAIAVMENPLPALSLAFAPDNSLLAVGTKEDLRLWSVAEGTLAHVLATGEDATEVVAFSPDGHYLVNSGQIPDMQLWNPADGTLIARLPGVGEDRLGIAFSPDSALLLTSELGGAISLWNLTTITENTVNRANLDTKGVFVYDVAWTPDDLSLLLFGATGFVYIWGIPPQPAP